MAIDFFDFFQMLLDTYQKRRIPSQGDRAGQGWDGEPWYQRRRSEFFDSKNCLRQYYSIQNYHVLLFLLPTFVCEVFYLGQL